jgi:hypothetical protein
MLVRIDNETTRQSEADRVSTLVVWINHSVPEWLTAETTRIPGIVVLVFQSHGNHVIETNH